MIVFLIFSERSRAVASFPYRRAVEFGRREEWRAASDFDRESAGGAERLERSPRSFACYNPPAEKSEISTSGVFGPRSRMPARPEARFASVIVASNAPLR
jgi:hypothetical protein